MELLMEHLGKGFINMLVISMPVVLTAAGIGLVVGILQAVTQVQEQTIAAAPKILGVFLVIMMMSGFFTKILTEYVIDSFNLAFKVIPKQDEFILPPSGMYEDKKGFFNDEKDYPSLKKPTVKTILQSPNNIPYSGKEPTQTVTKTNRSGLAEPNLAEKIKINQSR